MALSNARGWLMLNTGNKSEACMGYSTLYGDTAGAFAPLGGVYKTDVFAMARARNRRAAEAGETLPIPVNVFVKPPSAELAPDQEDEKSLGIDYATLDHILVASVEGGCDASAVASALVDDGYPADEAARLVDYVLSRTAANAFKRALEPPYPAAPFYG
jgi:NAD+ synthase (glutamine-hydrolysing)